MGEVSALKTLRTGLIAVALLSSGNAFAFDLTGAWASDRQACDHVFVKKGGAVDFAELSDLYGSGFIVNGDAIKAKAGKCTITSQRKDGDSTVLNASCATTIMTSDLQFRYKVIDDNTLVRDFPEIEGMRQQYSRCPM